MRPWVITTAVGWLPLAAWADPGDHLRAGSLEITPSLDVGAEFRTNVYRSEDGGVPAANLRVAPSLTVARSADDHDLRLIGQWELRKYLFEGATSTVPGFPPPSASSLDRFDQFAVSAGWTGFKQGVVGLHLAEDVRLVNFRADAEYADIPYSSNLRNQLRGAIRVSPGPALEISPGAGWTWDSYRIPSVNGSDRSLNSRNTYGPLLDVKWAFFPRTAVLANAEMVFVRWDVNEFSVAGGTDAEVIAVPDSREVKANVGLDGRLTEKISAQFLFGYGEATYDEGTVTGGATGASADAGGSDGLLFQGQVRYSFTPKTDEGHGNSIAAGYVRDFESSFFTNYVQIDKIFVDTQARFGVLEPSLRYELRFEDYTGSIERADLVHKAAADLRVRMTEWASFTTGGAWQSRASSDAGVEYDDFNLHALATVAY